MLKKMMKVKKVNINRCKSTMKNEKIKKVNIIDVFEKANTLFLEEQKELILSNFNK